MRIGNVLLALLILSGCASTRTSNTEQLPTAPVVKSSDALSTCKKWRLPLYGHVSHTSISADGQKILVSTSSEGKHPARIRLVDSAGKPLWIRDQPQPIKAQAIAASGEILAINTYDDRLQVYNSGGKKLWERQHLGRPVIASAAKRVLLLNDDDSDPNMAFVSYDFGGNQKALVKLTAKSDAEYPEPIDMFVSADQSYVLVALMKGAFIAYDLDGHKLASQQIAGEITAIAGTALPNPRVYVLTRQKLFAFEMTQEKKMQALWHVNVDRQYEAIHAVGDTLFVYGNTHLGQAVSAFNVVDGKELWRKSYNAPATYTSLVFPATNPAPSITAAIDPGHPAGILHIMAIGAKGDALWDAEVGADDGIYSYAVADKAGAVVVGTGQPGNGVIEYYISRAAGADSCE